MQVADFRDLDYMALDLVVVGLVPLLHAAGALDFATLLVLVACVVAASLLAWRAARAGSPVALGLIALLLATAVTERLVYWADVNSGTIILIAAAVSGAATLATASESEAATRPG